MQNSLSWFVFILVFVGFLSFGWCLTLDCPQFLYKFILQPSQIWTRIWTVLSQFMEFTGQFITIHMEIRRPIKLLPCFAQIVCSEKKIPPRATNWPYLNLRGRKFHNNFHICGIVVHANVKDSFRNRKVNFWYCWIWHVCWSAVIWFSKIHRALMHTNFTKV